MSKLENLNYKARILHLKSLELSKQRSTILNNELFRGNSIIISDCLVSGTSFLKTLLGTMQCKVFIVFGTLACGTRPE